MLGVEGVGEVKLTCKAGTVVLVHHDLFHRATRRLPEVWRPLFVLRDAVRMTEPVAGSAALRGVPAELPECEPASDSTLAALTQLLHLARHSLCFLRVARILLTSSGLGRFDRRLWRQ